MELDEDISGMKKKGLVAALKAYEDSGVKVTTGGNVKDLKTRLQATRNAQQGSTGGAAASGVVAGPRTTTTGTAQTEETPRAQTTGGKLKSTMLSYDGIHPITEICLDKLGQRETKFIIVETDQNAIARLNQHLKPVEKLVEMIVEVVEGWTELNSSAAINFGSLAKALRARSPFVVARRETVPVFEPFHIEVKQASGEGVGTAGDAAEEEAEEEAAIDALQAEMQARYQHDLMESSQASSEVRGPAGDVGATAETELGETEDTAGGQASEDTAKNKSEDTAKDENEDTALMAEVAVIQEAIRGFLREWLATFPKPGNPIWPQDFTPTEQGAVKKFVREYIRDESKGINLDLQKQPTDVTDAAVEAILGSANFPAIEGAKTKTIVTSVFRFECNNIYNTNLRNKAKKNAANPKGKGKKPAKKAKEAENPEDDEDSEDDEDDEVVEGSSEEDDGGLKKVKKPAGGTGRKRKHKSSSPEQPEGSDEDGEGDQDEEDEGEQGGVEYNDGLGFLGYKCVQCFFTGNECSLQGRNEAGRACTLCQAKGYPCRVACEECSAVAISAGRGSDGSMLAADCTECKYPK